MNQNNQDIPGLDWEQKGNMLYSINDKLSIENLTTGPDQLSSIISLALHDAAGLIEKFAEHEGRTDVTYATAMDLIVQVAQMYKMAESGMDEQEIVEILGMDKFNIKVHRNENVEDERS